MKCQFPSPVNSAEKIYKFADQLKRRATEHNDGDNYCKHTIECCAPMRLESTVVFNELSCGEQRTVAAEVVHMDDHRNGHT